MAYGMTARPRRGDALLVLALGVLCSRVRWRDERRFAEAVPAPSAAATAKPAP